MSGSGWPSRSAVSFLLIIPIEPIYLAPRAAVRPAHRLLRERALRPAGRAVGADPRQRACSPGCRDRRSPSRSCCSAIKALFFYADDGYRDASAGGPLACTPGADCVYQRYLAAGQAGRVEAAGRDRRRRRSRSFYWSQQLSTAGPMLAHRRGGRRWRGGGVSGSRTGTSPRRRRGLIRVGARARGSASPSARGRGASAPRADPAPPSPSLRGSPPRRGGASDSQIVSVPTSLVRRSLAKHGPLRAR